MSLSAASSDVLALIAAFIDGADVLRLYTCGDMPLLAHLRAAVTELHFQAQAYTAFPFGAYTFPNLRDFQVCVHDSHPLKMKKALPLPAQPMKSVKKVSLDFAQGLTALCGLPDDLRSGTSQLYGSVVYSHVYHQPSTDELSPMAKSFPSLETLILGRPSNVVPTALFQWLQTLPETLTHLDLTHASSQMPPVATLESKWLEMLPKQLRVFKVNHSVILPDPATKSFENLKWPPALTYLEAMSFHSATILWNLPQQLTHLDISLQCELSHSFLERVNHTYDCSLLPRGLIYCSVAGLYMKPFKLPAANLPPRLETLHMNVDFSEGVDYRGVFPQSITSYLGEIQALPRLDDVFPNLKNIDFQLTELQMQHLPPRLEVIPPTGYPSRDVRALPRSIRELNLALEPEHILDLPPLLTVLNLSGAATFDAPTFAALPRTLKAMNMYLWQVKEPGSLSGLKVLPRLESLSLTCMMQPPAVVQTSATTLQDPGFLDGIPTSLTGLVIMSVVECPWQTWFERNLPRLVNLRHCIAGGSFESAATASYAFLNTLPPGLKTLSIPVGEGLFLTDDQQNCFKRLPRTLESLELHASYTLRRPLEFTDAHFDSLPLSLTHLQINASSRTLTPALLDVLPPRCYRLHLTQAANELQAALTQFHFRPQWETYSPMVAYFR